MKASNALTKVGMLIANDMEGLLSADDLCRIRSRYHLRQTDMEQMLATGPKTWTRWERGKVPQNKAADKLIRLIAEDADLAKRLMDQAGVINEEAAEAFDRIEADAKLIARAALQAEFGDQLPADRTLLEIVSDKAFETTREARKRAALAF